MSSLPLAHEETLRRLSLNDERYVATVLARKPEPVTSPSLDARSQAYANLAALIALDGSQAAFDTVVSSALATGASPADVVDVLLAVAPWVGSARVVSSAPRIAVALGFDVSSALEHL